jgi:hypothetical protein
VSCTSIFFILALTIFIKTSVGTIWKDTYIQYSPLLLFAEL